MTYKERLFSAHAPHNWQPARTGCPQSTEGAILRRQFIGEPNGADSRHADAPGGKSSGSIAAIVQQNPRFFPNDRQLFTCGSASPWSSDALGLAKYLKT
jgi:hypothetical protein